jgi:PiT family inorganic phosphate transporter
VSSDVVLVIVVATALAFNFTNGFHDTANAIATSVSTRAMSPRFAVLLSAVLNFAGAFISLEVAATVGKGIVEANAVTTTVVFAGLIGAIAWNLATWYFGLPSSSSHALIGGLVGAAFAASGTSAIQGDGLIEKVIVPGIVAPILAFTVAASRSSSPTGSSAGCGRGRSTAPTGWGSSCRRRCSRWPTERMTPRRRWGSSRSR